MPHGLKDANTFSVIYDLPFKNTHPRQTLARYKVKMIGALEFFWPNENHHFSCLLIIFPPHAKCKIFLHCHRLQSGTASFRSKLCYLKKKPVLIIGVNFFCPSILLSPSLSLFLLSSLFSLPFSHSHMWGENISVFSASPSLICILLDSL